MVTLVLSIIQGVKLINFAKIYTLLRLKCFSPNFNINVWQKFFVIHAIFNRINLRNRETSIILQAIIITVN